MEQADKEFEDYLKFFDIVEGMPVAKQMVINKKTGVIKPKYDKHYVPCVSNKDPHGTE